MPSSTTGVARAASACLLAPGRSSAEPPEGNSFLQSRSFPKSRRLRKRRDYQAARKDGFAARAGEVVVVVAPSANDTARLGLIASRRTGNAVARNLLKRRARAWFRQRTEIGAFDVVVIFRAGAVELAYDELVAKLENALRRATKRLIAGRRTSALS